MSKLKMSEIYFKIIFKHFERIIVGFKSSSEPDLIFLIYLEIKKMGTRIAVMAR
jgi:hypothetical protein